MEPQYRLKSKRLRPFARSARVSALCCSGPLQRAIVDLAADLPFAQARRKLIEHYGIAIGESTIQRITARHAQAMVEASRADAASAEQPGTARPIVVEIDGSMVPIVEPNRDAPDKRKGKTLGWREAKLSLAHEQGSVTPIYGGSIDGGVAAAGQQMLRCAVRAGFGTRSRVHAVGDGAPWIVGQVDEQFGDQGRYLIDFYHVCEYLSAAAEVITCDAAAKVAWTEAQKRALIAGHVDAVLQALAEHCDGPGGEDAKSPVRRCHHYLSDRKSHLDYATALASGLPIGSGAIESAHRSVAQQRLKRPGAWWRVEHAEQMLALRILRLNGDWERYWQDARRSAAANDNTANPQRRRTA